jgi:hypothetical protein
LLWSDLQRETRVRGDGWGLVAQHAVVAQVQVVVVQVALVATAGLWRIHDEIKACATIQMDLGDVTARPTTQQHLTSGTAGNV